MPALVFDDQQIENVIDRVVDRTFRMDFSWDWPGGVAFTGYASLQGHRQKEYLEQLKAWVDEIWKKVCPSCPSTVSPSATPADLIRGL